jgi:DNA-binding Lrp family transcriptional regulator
LEDLASRFKISNKEVIQRIKDLEALERLTGIIDDRGKYIYLKRKELDVRILLTHRT